MEGSRRATIGIAVSVALVLATLAASTTASAAPALRSPLCPKLCWVINTAGIYSIERHSHLGWGRTDKRFANPRTYPIVQPNKVPPGSEDWDFYTTPPAHITDGGAHRMQQFWMFQALWMACPPGLASGHTLPAPPPDINAFFFDLEPGGPGEDIDLSDPLVRAYQAWVLAHLGVKIGTDAVIETERPRVFLPAFNAYVRSLSQRSPSDPCYRAAPLAVVIPAPSLGGTDVDHDPTKPAHQNFIDLNIAGAAAKDADMLGVQWQWDELDLPLYGEDNATTAAQAREVQPDIAILAVLSTLPRHCDPDDPTTCVTTSQLLSAFDWVRQVTAIDGFYLGAFALNGLACKSTDPPNGDKDYPLCRQDIELKAASGFLERLQMS